MSFTTFLVQIVKMLAGYVGGAILFFAGMMGYGTGQTTIGAILVLVGFVLFVFGIYNQKALQ